MFTKSYDIAKKFTFPLIVSIRFQSKKIESGLGAFVILNDEGWLMTAAHNFGVAFAFNQHQKEYKEFLEKVDRINSNKEIKDHQRKIHAKALQPNPNWITDFAILLGGNPIQIQEYYIYAEHDIAFFKVDKSVISGQTIFPKIIDPTIIKPGRSLMKLGYPFVEIKPLFNESTNSFELSSDQLSVPFFPIEGIYTRNLIKGKTDDSSMDIMFLETSSPGLKGQSGGPICDIYGNLYAIQSQNVTLPLGFKGKTEVSNKVIEENQFLNVGIGVHPKTIVELLKKHNIRFETAV